VGGGRLLDLFFGCWGKRLEGMVMVGGSGVDAQLGQENVNCRAVEQRGDSNTNFVIR
jgi:hypothetical protein